MVTTEVVRQADLESQARSLAWLAACSPPPTLAQLTIPPPPFFLCCAIHRCWSIQAYAYCHWVYVCLALNDLASFNALHAVYAGLTAPSIAVLKV